MEFGDNCEDKLFIDDMEPRQDICDAIKNKHRIEFIYHNEVRVGNPQCYGINRTGKEAIRIHLVKGGSRPEQMFLLGKMISLKILEERFHAPGPNYRKGDVDMKVIFCEL